MAYRRRHGMGRSSTYVLPSDDDGDMYTTSSSLAAQALKASAANSDSSRFKDHPKGGSHTYDYTSMGSSNEDGGLWGVLARKAKSILEDENAHHSKYHSDSVTWPEMLNSSRIEQAEMSTRLDNPTLRKRLDALASSMNRIGDSIGNALEEGRTIVENKTADLIQETRKLQLRKKGINLEELNFESGAPGSWKQRTESPNQTSQEDQLKASRDVAMATAAKAKLLLRELKTLKADLTFSKERCSQLEEENRILREARDKGVNPADDDMIRLQLETLLAEKARLAHENSVYARENRFLREIVEYHQLTMQDVVYLDEGSEEFTEVISPIPVVYRTTLSMSPPSPRSLASPTAISCPKGSSASSPLLIEKQ
ncbi:uncharacterized protein [Primulina huaijiensis]|uniref:uncharacterized protein n=1 Tax=Primulina huaijiensis TaxID=1492673 RepID=UPI003CC765AF